MNNKRTFVFTVIGFFTGYGTATLLAEDVKISVSDISSASTYQANKDQQIKPFSKQLIEKPAHEKLPFNENSQVALTKLIAPKQVEKISNIKSANIAYTEKYEQLENRYLRAQEKIIQLEFKLNDLEVSEISDHQLNTLFSGASSENFANLVTGYTGEIRDDIYNFHQKKDLQDSGYSNSQHISDFITTHLNSLYIELDAVVCKFDQCEIRIIEKQANSWESIMNDMRQQSWWTFSNSSARSTSDREGNLYIYIFLSQ